MILLDKRKLRSYKTDPYVILGNITFELVSDCCLMPSE